MSQGDCHVVQHQNTFGAGLLTMTNAALVLFSVPVFLCVFCWAQAAKAAETAIEGLALVRLEGKKLYLEMDQVVSVGPNGASFVGLDDFGGEVFRISFDARGMLVGAAGEVRFAKKDKFAKLVSLPLSQKEFLEIISFDPGKSFTVVKQQSQICWHKPKTKDLFIGFDDFIKVKAGRWYPRHISIKHKKNSFDLKWIKFKRLM
ncbi:MAG: hypothetical protein ACD_62C00170G0025 [uncultured bacterium]|nr:MAG: hypothetical protein ACD_62C00170G0025 [uncultured bacterium]